MQTSLMALEIAPETEVRAEMAMQGFSLEEICGAWSQENRCYLCGEKEVATLSLRLQVEPELGWGGALYSALISLFHEHFESSLRLTSCLVSCLCREEQGITNSQGGATSLPTPWVHDGTCGLAVCMWSCWETLLWSPGALPGQGHPSSFEFRGRRPVVSHRFWQLCMDRPT